MAGLRADFVVFCVCVILMNSSNCWFFAPNQITTQSYVFSCLTHSHIFLKKKNYLLRVFNLLKPYFMVVFRSIISNEWSTSWTIRTSWKLWAHSNNVFDWFIPNMKGFGGEKNKHFVVFHIYSLVNKCSFPITEVTKYERTCCQRDKYNYYFFPTENLLCDMYYWHTRVC